MAIGASGPISMSMLNREVGKTVNASNTLLAGSVTPSVGSLFYLGNQPTSGAVNQSAPHAISEWYGYTLLRDSDIVFDTSSEFTNTATTGGFSFTHTPINTPRGVLVFALNETSNTDRISTVTYGGASLTRVTSAIHPGGGGTEPTHQSVWFLGSNVPDGPEPVTFVLNTSTTDDYYVVATTVYNTNNYDVVVEHSGSLAGSAVTNPAVTLNYNGYKCLSFTAIGSGLPNTTDLTLLSNMTAIHSEDFGANVGRVDRQTSASLNTNFVIGYTASVDDATIVGVALRPIQMSPTPTPSITPTITPTISLTPTVTTTVTPTISVTRTATVTPTISVTPSLTPTITPTISITPSLTPTITPTISLTPTRTPTVTRTPSLTPSGVSTVTLVAGPEMSSSLVLAGVTTYSSSFGSNPSANSILVVAVTADAFNPTEEVHLATMTSNPSLTWQRAVTASAASGVVSASFCPTEIWWAALTSSVRVGVTASWAGVNYYSRGTMAGWAYSNSDGTLPKTGSKFNSITKVANVAIIPTGSITTSRTGSTILGVIGDWSAASGSFTFTSASAVMDYTYYAAGSHTGYYFHHSDLTNTTTYVEGLTAPSPQKAGICFLEVGVS